MERIQDYIIIEKIAETRVSQVYRGRREGRENTVVIKILQAKFPTPSRIARFKQEYELIKNLDIEEVIKTFDIISYNNGFALILEDFNGVSIKSILNKKLRFDMKSFLKISEKLAEILGNIHMKGVSHRDIKPNNILLNLETGAVRITDFGVSADFTHEHYEIYNPDFIAGTLAYVSPEKTGRMNRAVDYRTDLYSLGITLYEMLTGRLPFESRDPLEIIHSHIAIKPVPLSVRDPGIPLVISDIVMKLLSKNPEDRYQNGFGLMADLVECRRQFEESGKIKPFSLARHDISNRFIIPQKLFGREKEEKILLSCFEDVAASSSGSAMAVLVSGAPGIGKSALINEIHKPIVEKRGYFISGKYEQFRRDKPYSAIIQAFQSLVRQILSESEERVSIWKEELLDKLGTNGRVITEVIPEVELLIGKQPELPLLGPEESKNRFNFVFERFTSVFTSKDHPVALFLDDLQWADIASLHLVRNIVTDAEIRNLLLILSYRDDEINEYHPVMDFLKRMETLSVRFSRITLGPLNEKNIKDLVVNFLKCSDMRSTELARLLHEKTGGNPFFIKQFLLSLYHEKMIVPDENLGWKWDINRIDKMQVTDNLVEMMAAKIGWLSAKTQEVLKICACIGNRFDLDTIAGARGTSIYDALNDLGEAIQNGLISPLGDNYIFHHDRIQEAAYSLVTGDEKSGLHYKIGKMAMDAADENELQNKLFYIADQLNLGVKMISSSGERERLARLNLEAGKKAKASAAYTPAFGYLKSGIELLEENSWQMQYDLTLTLYTESVEAAYLMGNFDKMNELAEDALHHTKTTLDRVNILVSRINACIAQEDFQGAIDSALPIVKLFGINIPKRPTRVHIAIELLKFKIKIIGKKPEDLLDLPEMTDPEILAAVRILVSMAHAAFYAAPNMLAVVILKALRLSCKYGLAPEYAFAFAGYGAVLAAGLWDFNNAVKFGVLGLRLIEKLGARAQECKTIFVYNALIRHWVKPIKETIAPMKEGYAIGMETGDLDYAGFSLFFADGHSQFSGLELSELERSFAKTNLIIAGINQKHLLTIQSIVWQTILNLLGKCRDPLKLTGKAMDAEQFLPVWTSANNFAALSVYWYDKLLLCIFYNDYSGALEASNKFKKYKNSMQGIYINKYAVFFDSIARIFMYQHVSWIKKITFRIQLKVNRIMMKKWSDIAPTNTLHLLVAVDALYAWAVLGKMTRAENGLESAIRLCKKYRDVVYEGFFNTYALKFHIFMGNEKKAREHMSATYIAYSRWGATGLLKNLLKNYPDMFHSARIDSGLPKTASDSSLKKVSSVSLDLSKIVTASQEISGEIVFSRLLVKMMRIIIEITGAQKGFIILEESGRLMIAAEASIGSDEIKVYISMPVELSDALSAAIVNQVAGERSTLILNDAASDGEFINDLYIAKNKPRSILCSPILNQGRLSAILYLENNLVTGAFTPERLEMLNTISSQIAISIDNARLYENLEGKVKERTDELQSANYQLIRAKNSLWGELELAKKIQTMLLPKKPEMPGYSICTYMMPAHEVGGDYYDFINIEGKEWIVIGDVSGHGVSAGLVMMMAQTAIHNTLTHNPEISPAGLLTIINKTIICNLSKMDEDKFMTITVLAANGDGQFTFSGLHQDIMIYRANSRDVERIATTGMMVGAIDDIKGKMYNETLKLNKDDVMLLYTDGITEAWNKNATGVNKRTVETMFGQKRLAGILHQNGENSPDEIQDAVLNEMQNFLTDDDITLVVIKRLV